MTWVVLGFILVTFGIIALATREKSDEEDQPKAKPGGDSLAEKLVEKKPISEGDLAKVITELDRRNPVSRWWKRRKETSVLGHTEEIVRSVKNLRVTKGEENRSYWEETLKSRSYEDEQDLLSAWREKRKTDLEADTEQNKLRGTEARVKSEGLRNAATKSAEQTDQINPREELRRRLEAKAGPRIDLADVCAEMIEEARIKYQDNPDRFLIYKEMVEQLKREEMKR